MLLHPAAKYSISAYTAGHFGLDTPFVLLLFRPILVVTMGHKKVFTVVSLSEKGPPKRSEQAAAVQQFM